MSELVHDSHFWVLLAFIFFVLIAYKKGKVPVLAMLDSRTARIQSDLEEAARLRREAQELLDDSKKKNDDAVITAQKILDNATSAAERLQKEAAAKIEESLKQREAVLLERIARAEATAVHEVRVQAADMASRAAEKIMTETLSKNGGKLVDDAIRDLSARAS